MAEEVKEEVKIQFDENKIADLIKQNVNTSMQEVMANLTRQQQENQQTSTQQPQQQTDIWDELIGEKVNPKLSQALSRAEYAEDLVNFYQSEEWENVDKFLVEEEPEKRREEKREIRKTIETYFGNLTKNNRGLPRKNIFHAVIGEKMEKDKGKIEELAVKKAKNTQDLELERARRAVDISTGNISNFSAKDIHEMPVEKMLEELGNYQF